MLPNKNAVLDNLRKADRTGGNTETRCRKKNVTLLVRIEVFTEVGLNVTVFWDVTHLVWQIGTNNSEERAVSSSEHKILTCLLFFRCFFMCRLITAKKFLNFTYI
jgi:hypothetical protein